MSDSVALRLVGGPTALIGYGEFRLLTDPTLDPPGKYPRPGNIVLRKLAGPAVGLDELLPIDVVLLSHDHHPDNLDPAGRAMLPRAGRVLTTVAGAERLGLENATGLQPGEAVELKRPSDRDATVVTAVLAEHGPPEIAARTGPVIGFVLRGVGLPTVYVSGDNASAELVRQIVDQHGPIELAVLFVGGAQLPQAWGDAFLTLTADTAVEAARALAPAPIVPIHQHGWAHFSSSPQDVRRAFAAAGLSDRLVTVEPGQEVALA